MNLNNLLGMVKNFAPNQFGRVQGAISKAQETMKKFDINNPAKSLKEAGIDKNFLNNLKNTSNPIKNFILKELNLDDTNANSILDNLSNSMSNINHNNNSNIDDLSKYKNGLKSLK